MAKKNIPDDPFLQNLLAEAKAYQTQKLKEVKKIEPGPPGSMQNLQHLFVDRATTTPANSDYTWTLINSYDEFVARIEDEALPWPKVVSITNNLGAGQKTGMDCLNWLVQYCLKTKKDLPECTSHSKLVTQQQQVENLVLDYLSKRRKQ